jgi:hypothetical protein
MQIEIDAKQLSNEVANISGSNSLWDNFKTHFNSVNKNTYRPLRKMSEWHLSLALAAGQVSGVALKQVFGTIKTKTPPNCSNLFVFS